MTPARVAVEPLKLDVPLTIEPMAQGYGDNTIVWVPQGVPGTKPAGDIIYSGTPENVGPVVRGDVIDCHIDGLPNLGVKIV